MSRVQVTLGVTGFTRNENHGVTYGVDREDMLVAAYEEAFRRDYGYFPGRFTLSQWREGEAARKARGVGHAGPGAGGRPGLEPERPA